MDILGLWMSDQMPPFQHSYNIHEKQIRFAYAEVPAKMAHVRMVHWSFFCSSVADVICQMQYAPWLLPKTQGIFPMSGYAFFC